MAELVYAIDSKSIVRKDLRVRVSPRAQMRGYYRNTFVNQDKHLQSYVVGLALGDGNLSNPNGRAVRLRITCDKKYPLLIKRISDSLCELFPENRVGLVDDHNKNYLNVSVFSNHLQKIILGQNLQKLFQKILNR